MAEDTTGTVAPFDEVYREHADAVYRFCLSQLQDPPAAEDLAGDVFAAAFAAYETARPQPNGVRAWLFRIARNAVIDEHRRRRFRSGAFPRQAGSGASVDLEAEVEAREELREVLAGMKTLRRRDQILVGLRIAGGLSHAEAGAVVGLNENAARMAVQRAISKIRQHMGPRA